jgi:heparan-alpha-glucosaminide N-acetyltransferase
MKTYQTHRARFIRLLIHGLIWAAVGTGLCGASQNAGVLPLNKNLWTFSFTALLGGLAFWLLAICFLLIDWIRIWKGAPFTYVGMNSIVVYMGHEILEEYFPFSWSWKAPHTRVGEYSTHWTMTASNLIGACWWLVIAFVLFKKKIFIRV